MAPWPVVSLVSLLVGCGSGAVPCTIPELVLAGDGDAALTCGDVDEVQDWISLLAGRPVAGGDRIRATLVAEYQGDSVATQAWLASVRTAANELGAMRGPTGAEARAQHVWRAATDQGFVQSRHGDLWNLQKAALSIWATSDEEQLALTEADIEGWLHYASLCREMQRAGPLKLSFADRVPAYQTVSERFLSGSRAEKIALSRMGHAWPHVREAWGAASYDKQQAVIVATPLPPPMTSTSLGYVHAVIELDLVAAATNIDEQLGPFTVKAP